VKFAAPERQKSSGEDDMKYISKEKLKDFLGGLVKENLLWGITDGRYEPIKEMPELELKCGTQKFSPKEILLPQDESLMIYRDGEVREAFGGAKRVVWAIRPCDAYGLELLGKIFYQDPIDPYYKRRRENTIIIAIACREPLPGCFCTSFPAFDPFKRYEADLLLCEGNEGYYLIDASENGKKLLNDWEEVQDELALKEIENVKRNLAEQLESQKVNTAELKSRMLNRFEDIEFWRELGDRCLGCGICTFLCPTCYCFDISDERVKGIVRRARFWDACQFPLFTLEASGHNPRPSRTHRMRQRFMHKLSFFAQKFGHYQCVGCGRCVIYCPVNIDIREVINRA